MASHTPFLIGWNLHLAATISETKNQMDKQRGARKKRLEIFRSTSRYQIGNGGDLRARIPPFHPPPCGGAALDRIKNEPCRMAFDICAMCHYILNCVYFIAQTHALSDSTAKRDS